MGYAAENGPTRSSYLLAARKLRGNAPDAGRSTPAISPSILHAMSAGEMFDYLGTRIDGPRAGTRKIVINWRFIDTKETLASTLEHGALTWISGKSDPRADATVTTTRQVLEPIILGQKTLDDAMAHGISAAGNAESISDLWALLVDFKSGIPLVEPRTN
jgi:alkyl sulfatase BDS1-like metallo-beta-lactamase superfamily hydrolase